MISSKTIFIVVGRGIIVRNILRNAFFDKVRSNPNLNVVIFFPKVKDVEPPKYIEEELGGSRVKFEYVPNKTFSGARGFLYDALNNLVYSRTRRLYMKYGTAKMPIRSLPARLAAFLFFAPLSRLSFLKRFVRLLEFAIFKDEDYAAYFNTYKPDVVMCTALLSNTDVIFAKEALRRKIPLLAMPKSWDNLDKVLFKFEPTLFLVQNEKMKRDSVYYQAYHASRIKTIGFPQFDLYADKSILKTKEDYCAQHGFDSSLPILFLGSEGLWTPGDENHFRAIIQARDAGKIPPCNLLIRPHFSCIATHKFHEFRGVKNVCVDDAYRQSSFFMDRWDPTRSDMIDFTNSLHHCAIMVTFASTLALDASCFDKPIVTISYGSRVVDKNGKKEDWTHLLYETGFYHDVVKTKATTFARTEDELVAAINEYLLHPEIKRAERAVLRDELCFKVDGNAGNRLYEEVIRHAGLTA